MKERWIGPYEVLDELGRGGMGVVYRARHGQIGREVALKLLLASAGDETAKARFLTESRAAGQLDHPNLVPVRDAGWEGPNPYLVMDLIEGETLAERIARGGPLPIEEAVAIMAEVARGVAFAHERSILHRDLKPENVLLEQGRPRVADFGLAKELGSDDSLTKTGDLMGTPAFASPEQLDGDKRRVGRATDVYGLGATLFTLLAGRPPFEASGRIQLIAKVLGEEPPALRSLRPEVPADLAELCARCLAKEPADRPRSAKEVAEALETLAQAPASRAPSPLLLGVAVLAFGVVLAGVLLAVTQPGAPAPPAPALSSVDTLPSPSPPPLPPSSLSLSPTPAPQPASSASLAPTPTRPETKLRATWTQVPHRGTPARGSSLHAAAFVGERLFVLGGRNPRGKALAQFLSWEEGTWRVLPRPPPARYGHDMAWDPERGVLVSFGGKAKSKWLGDLWEWSPTGGWTDVTPKDEPIRNLAWYSMTYVAGRGVVLVSAHTDSPCLTLWSWAGSGWKQETPDQGPPMRFHAEIAALDGRLLVFGGESQPDTKPLADLWEWKRTWREVPAAGPVGGRGLLVACSARELLLYEPTARRSWLLREDVWHPLQTNEGPSARKSPTLSWDAKRARAILFGGQPVKGPLSAEVWTLTLER